MAEIFTSVKLRDKISHKTAERPRMSLDMVGEGILILLDGKSGNIENQIIYSVSMLTDRHRREE